MLPTCLWDLSLPLQVNLVAYQDDALRDHVVVLPQVHQDVLGGVEALPVHHRVDYHEHFRVVR